MVGSGGGGSFGYEGRGFAIREVLRIFVGENWENFLRVKKLWFYFLSELCKFGFFCEFFVGVKVKKIEGIYTHVEKLWFYFWENFAIGEFFASRSERFCEFV